MRVQPCQGMPSIDVTHFSDPCCPWAYSASPFLAVLRWRYGDQLDWRHVMIGLTENGRAVRAARLHAGAPGAAATCDFRKRGMPFATSRAKPASRRPRAPAAPSSRRGWHAPELELAAFRAIQFGWFTTPCSRRPDEAILEALPRVDGPRRRGVVALLDDPEVVEALPGRPRRGAHRRGRPTEAQGRPRNSDGKVRFTAPSLIFRQGDRSLEAGGFQPSTPTTSASRTSTRRSSAATRRSRATTSPSSSPPSPGGSRRVRSRRSWRAATTRRTMSPPRTP